ncbi:MAG: NAD(+)/NADH kinase, partial [Treponema sp.]|nr:NAD(+)/NADH kinase [Treponema sp.]
MKKCIIVENSFKKDSRRILEELKAFLSERKIESSVFSYDGTLSRTEPLTVDFSGSDFAVTLGGDGTVLFASRECAPYGIPVFSINLGEFGFIASVQKENWKKELALFLDGKSTESLRSLIDVEVVRSSKTAFRSRCLNDAVV